MIAASSLSALTYSRLAPRYDRLHGRWLRHAGGEAQSALEAATRALLRPGMALLDAGCGTGAFARRLAQEFSSPVEMTLLDPSREMLNRCADIHAGRVSGRLECLPFEEASFDLVTCAWALETTDFPLQAIDEMKRVTRVGGAICIAFCAEGVDLGLSGALLKQAIGIRRTGAFLHPSDIAAALEEHGSFAVSRLPCRGPAAVLLARARSNAATVLSSAEKPPASALDWSRPAADSFRHDIHLKEAPCSP